MKCVRTVLQITAITIMTGFRAQWEGISQEKVPPTAALSFANLILLLVIMLWNCNSQQCNIRSDSQDWVYVIIMISCAQHIVSAYLQQKVYLLKPSYLPITKGLYLLPLLPFEEVLLYSTENINDFKDKEVFCWKATFLKTPF